MKFLNEIFQYVGADLQLPDHNGMKCMSRVRKILCNVDGNLEGTGNYLVWVDHNNY